MPFLEQVNPEMLKDFPYFMEWLKELNREPADVLDFAVQADVVEVPSDTDYKKFEPADTYTASITFKDLSRVERRGKWSENKQRSGLTEGSALSPEDAARLRIDDLRAEVYRLETWLIERENAV